MIQEEYILYKSKSFQRLVCFHIHHRNRQRLKDLKSLQIRLSILSINLKLIENKIVARRM